jgi:hypothetical protein
MHRTVAHSARTRSMSNWRPNEAIFAFLRSVRLPMKKFVRQSNLAVAVVCLSVHLLRFAKNVWFRDAFFFFVLPFHMEMCHII